MKLFLLSVFAICVACLGGRHGFVCSGLKQDYSSFVQLQGLKDPVSAHSAPPATVSEPAQSRRRWRTFSPPTRSETSHRSQSVSPRTSRPRSRSGSSHRSQSGSPRTSRSPSLSSHRSESESRKHSSRKRASKSRRIFDTLESLENPFGHIDKSRFLPSFLATLDFVVGSLILEIVLKDPFKFTGMHLDPLLSVVNNGQFRVLITTSPRSVYWDMHRREEMERIYNTKIIDAGDSQEKWCKVHIVDNKSLVTDVGGEKYVTMLIRMNSIAPADLEMLSGLTEDFYKDDSLPNVLKQLYTAMGTKDWNLVYGCAGDDAKGPGFSPKRNKQLEFVRPSIFSFNWINANYPFGKTISEETLGSDEFYNFVLEGMSKQTADFEGKTYRCPRYTAQMGEKGVEEVHVDFTEIENPQRGLTEEELKPFGGSVEAYRKHVEKNVNNGIRFAADKMKYEYMFISPMGFALGSDPLPRWVGKVFVFNRNVYLAVPKYRIKGFVFNEDDVGDYVVVGLPQIRALGVTPRTSNIGLFVRVKDWKAPDPDAVICGVPLSNYVHSVRDSMMASIKQGPGWLEEQAKAKALKAEKAAA